MHRSGYLRTIIIHTKRTVRAGALATATLLVCSATSYSEIHKYSIAVDADISRLHVTAHFAAVIHDIGAFGRNAEEFLLDARECETDEHIGASDRRMQLPESGIRCLTYTVDLDKAASSDPRNRTLAATNALISPAAWLWRPKVDADNEIEARFELAGNVQVAVPWLPVSGAQSVYRLSASPENSAAPMAFGDFSHTVVRVGNSDLAVTVFQPKTKISAEEIFDWVQSTASNVTLAYDRFPSPGAHVFIIPAGTAKREGRSGLFGRVIRDGGEIVEFRLDENQPIEDYYGHWTATHEFSHLLLPYVYTRHRWISEGFAQYHQNVLLARAGTYTENAAWQNLYDGFERGRNSSPRLSPNSAAADRDRASTMKVYWSGAALALMADVELRRRSDGRESLDVVLDRLQQCCLPSPSSWDGIELLEQMDSLVETPVFVPLYDRMADVDGFPDVSPLLISLGLEIEGDVVMLSSDAEFSAIRTAITARRHHVKQ